MEKDFDSWNEKKKQVDRAAGPPFWHERELWWCTLGTNVGFEQDGKGENFARPVIVFRKFSKQVFWAVPLTTRNKAGKFYLPIDLGDGIHRMAILSQLRLMDGKRLYQKMGAINEKTHHKLEERIVRLCRGL